VAQELRNSLFEDEALGAEEAMAAEAAEAGVEREEE